MGALACAWQLVRLDPDRYEITVYQRGWRLGGKGASGRNLEPGKGLRVEEHGLHILMGFYDNVFHVLKSCYDDLEGFGRWEDALSPSDIVHICDRYRNGEDAIWEMHLPAYPAEAPGARPPSTEPDVADWLRKGFAFLVEVFRNDAEDPGRPPAAVAFARSESSRVLVWLARAMAGQRLRHGLVSDALVGAASRSIRAVLAILFQRMGDPERRDPLTTARRRQAMAAYFVAGNLLGILQHRLWTKQDFMRVAPLLDEMDYRAWLHRTVGSIGERWPELAWDSPLVNDIYNLIFSRRAGFGAGAALYDTLSMLLNYQGHVYYRMNGGMGDVVFAPLYLWLRQRGVRFRFFHRVRALHVDPRTPDRAVSEIMIERQLDGPSHAYDPLISVKGRPCWPNVPLREQLAPADRRRLEETGHDLEASPETFGRIESLRRGRDFDQVVLGIPVGALQAEPELVGELATLHPPLREMIGGIRTVATRAMQLWTDSPPSAMGWRGGQAMLAPASAPFAAWGDMSQVLPGEGWDATTCVRSVGYFCDTYDGPEEGASEVVRCDALRWLERSIGALMPSWSWERLAGGGGCGPERLDAQYWRANVSPSDRYVLAVPGSSRFRLAPDASGFENLFLAGDWVKTELNAGCVEAAAMAGLGAARALHARTNREVVPARAPVVPRPPAPDAPYVERDSDWALRPPVHVERAVVAAFVLRADLQALRSLCHAQIDETTGGAVTARPWPAQEGLVLLVCSDMPSVRSGDEQHGPLGFFRERDVGLFVPVEVTRAGGPRAIALYCPYLFVDSMVGLIAGREIFGLPKLLAGIEMSPPSHAGGLGRDLRIVVTSDVLERAGNGGGLPELHRAPVIEVLPFERAAPSEPPDLGLWRLAPALVWRGLMATGRGHARAELPLLSLKQFRDAGAPRRACHQSLVLCPAWTERMGVPRRLGGGFTIRLHRHAKPNVGGELGLDDEPVPRLAFQLSCDLWLPPASRLWPT